KREKKLTHRVPIRTPPTKVIRATKTRRAPNRRRTNLVRRQNQIKPQNGKVRLMCRTMSSTKPSESNSRSCRRKKRKIDNTLLRYGWNRKASFTFVSRKECALPAIILWRKTTTRSLQCRNFRGKCRSKVKAVCWR